MKRIRELLEQEKIAQKLTPYSGKIAGTFPLGIEVENSDIDIICEACDLTAFAARLKEAFARYPRFSITTGSRQVVCRFAVQEFEVEIYGENRPIDEQNAWRHLQIEARILKAAGEKFRNRIISLKRAGVKTEPAFARLLQLKGDPFEALLTLESLSDCQLTERIRKSGYEK